MNDILQPIKDNLQKNNELMEVIRFFQERLSFIDFLIIGLGIFLLIWQVWKRFTTFSGRFYRHAQEKPLFLLQTELKLEYLSNLIELLPMLGLFGTVWGLMLALVTISNNPSATIKDIATQIAPAISTTFFGLFFAITNTVLYNNLHAYYSELIAWSRHQLQNTNTPNSKPTLPNLNTANPVGLNGNTEVFPLTDRPIILPPPANLSPNLFAPPSPQQTSSKPPKQV